MMKTRGNDLPEARSKAGPGISFGMNGKYPSDVKLQI
jgi:hypothetical protein